MTQLKLRRLGNVGLDQQINQRQEVEACGYNVNLNYSVACRRDLNVSVTRSYRKRRQYTPEFKAQLVAESQGPTR